MKTEIHEGCLIITIPLELEPTLSSTGKTRIIASTRGARNTNTTFQGKPVLVAVNAMIKEDQHDQQA